MADPCRLAMVMSGGCFLGVFEKLKSGNEEIQPHPAWVWSPHGIYDTHRPECSRAFNFLRNPHGGTSSSPWTPPARERSQRGSLRFGAHLDAKSHEAPFQLHTA